jgi:hypothetical protein
MRSANALERLCCVLAITTLDLVAQGTAVVASGKRRWVDAHGFSGQSYLTIGWHGVTLALSRGDPLIPSLHLNQTTRHWHTALPSIPLPRRRGFLG